MKVLTSRTVRPLAESELRSDEMGRAWWSGLRSIEEQERVAQARHVWLDPESGSGFTPSGRRLTETIQWPHRTRLPTRRAWVTGAFTARRVRMPAVSLRDAGMERNWYHLLVDLLGGRLRLADEVVGRDLAVVIPPGLPTQATDALRRGGFADREWIVQPEHRWLFVDTLTVVTAPRYDPAAIRYLWDNLAVPVADPTTADRLLVAREPGTGREWANHDEVMGLARRYGLQIIKPATTPLDEQMERFGRASLVVGAHGAGMTGVLWRRAAPLDIIDIQVRGRNAPMGNFAVIAAWTGARYLALGDSLWKDPGGNPKGSQPRAWKQDALVVDTDALARAIESCLDGRELP